MTSRYISSTSSSSLDSQKHNRNKFCGQWSAHGPVDESERSLHECLELKCKGWTCASCGPKKARRLRRAIVEKATAHNLRRFLTLTLDPKACTPEESIPYIRQCWNMFRTYLRREFKTKIAFITILELQRSGYAHLHVLLDRYVEQSWISKAWQALGGGRIVDIRYVDVHRVSAYLSKYLTKEVLLAGFKRGQRRYTASKGMDLLKQDKSKGWAVIKARLDTVHYNYRKAIVQAVRNEDGSLRSFLYWHCFDGRLASFH